MKKCSDLRVSELTSSLPTLKKDLSDKMRKVQSDLNGLPKSFADNPQAHLLTLCNAFVQEIGSYTNGKPTYPPNQRTFLRDALRHYRVLEKEIKRTRPQFEVAPSSESAASISLEVIEEDSTDGTFARLYD